MEFEWKQLPQRKGDLPRWVLIHKKSNQIVMEVRPPFKATQKDFCKFKRYRLAQYEWLYQKTLLHRLINLE